MPTFRLILIAVLAVLAMSTVPVLVKSTVANEVTLGISRLSIALLAFTPWVIASLQKLSRADWINLAIIGATFALHWLCYFASIKLATPTIAAMAISTYGVQYLLLAWLVNGDRFSILEWGAIATCLLGCVIVTPDWSLANNTTRGIVIGLFSALLYAALPLLHQRASLQSPALNNTVRAWGQFGFALLCFLPLWQFSDWQLGKSDWYMLLTLGLVSTIIAHGLWVKVTTELPPLYTSMIYYLYVPLAMVQSVWFLNEPLTTEKVVGATMIVISSIGISLFRAYKTNDPLKAS